MISTFIDAGVFAIAVMASLPLLMRRRLHHCQVIHCFLLSLLVVKLASLPLL
jgi:hypothetical protein